MERLKERYSMVVHAVDTLGQAIKKLSSCSEQDENYESFRDSLIKRFEYSMDTFWKFLKEFLQKKHGIAPAASPSKIFRQCLDAQILTQDEYERALDVVEDRNMTSHTYNELLAEEISKDIPKHYLVIHSVLCRIGKESDLI